MRTGLIFLALLLSFQLVAQPLVIAHRGASGYLPEHTLEAAVLAYAQGADYIEQDLVLSKDGQLIVLHDIVLQTSTNVADVFPDRARADGQFYAIDFTLAEIKQLSKFERVNAEQQQVFPQRFQSAMGFQISTWEEQVQLIRELNRQSQRNIGFYPELKAPAWHSEQGQNILQTYVASLDALGMNNREMKIITQCFDWAATQALRNTYGLKTELVQLIAENDWAESSTDYEYLQSSAGVKAMAEVVDGIGPWLPQLYNVETQKVTPFAQMLQQTDLMLHPYTHRDDALGLADTVPAQLSLIFDEIQASGIFTDHVDSVVRFLESKH